MTDSTQASHSTTSAEGSGAATSAGIVFQQQLGAFIGVLLLSGRRLDERLNLGTARPVSLRFETEAPVDDVLVHTSTNGYVAIQAKTTVSLSGNLASPFGKTVSQFVRHWIACRDGDGSHGWNRPLDPAYDRLVLAVSGQAPVTIRVHLPAALRRRSQQGRTALTKAQCRALKYFDSCVTQAWASSTTEEFDPKLLDRLADLVTVFVFDPSGADRTLMQEILVASILESSDAGTALTALEAVSGQMMARRVGADLTSLRQALMTKGVKLRAARRYQKDIAALREHTQAVAHTLQRHEKIAFNDGETATIVRECQEVVGTAATENSLLIVGEPGAGKSGVLNVLARSLLNQGHDVLELAVDQHSVESLEGLSRDLRLEHGLLEVLEAWDGTGPGWLIVDALDATRGGRGEGIFRKLIELVLTRCKRWRVVASIRTFDLRMGRQFRDLFPGTPPSEDFTEPDFPNVRHVRIPPWSDTEFQQLLAQAPTLSAALADAPARLRELAYIPFNTHLLSELIDRAVGMADLRQVSSQLELLRLYWSYRIEVHGTPAELCLRNIADAIVKARTLRVRKRAFSSNDAAMIDMLAHEGVLIAVGDGPWVQFRHHILFDFTAAQVLLEPDEIVSGKQRFPKEEANGLMLAPALAFVLQRTWDSETHRTSFWAAVANILADEEGDPVIRSAVGRIGAEYPTEMTDTVRLAERIVADDNEVIRAFPILSGALGVYIDDHPDAPADPWTKLLGALSPNVGSVRAPVRFLLFKLIERTQNDVLRVDLGLAARALLAHGYSLQDPTGTVGAAIAFVADTYQTNRDESRKLLSKVFDKDRLKKFAWQEVPAVCHKIEAIIAADPDFGTEVYRHTYTFAITEDQRTDMSSSQILSLTSTARQDYDMARYVLGQFISRFLEDHPSQATTAIIDSVEGYVAREHRIPEDFHDHTLRVASRTVRLREDYSHIWAHDPDSEHHTDAQVLVAKLLEYLRSSEETIALTLATQLVDNASLAVFWSRVFMAAAQRNDRMVPFLLPFALTEQFLVMPDTRKDAIDVVTKGYARLSSLERQRFEKQALSFDFSDFVHTTEARDHFLRRLFSTIGRGGLETDGAREFVVDSVDEAPSQNERLFVVRTRTGHVGQFDLTDGGDAVAPANAALTVAIETAKRVLVLEPNSSAPPNLTWKGAYEALAEVEHALNAPGVNPQLRIHGEGVLGQGCNRIIGSKLLPREDDRVGTENLLRMLRVATNSVGPQVDKSTEATFETTASWASPAPRVEGAQAVLDLVLQRPDLLPAVSDEIDALLADSHPAVRMQAALHLVRIWDIDRDGFWRRLNGRLNQEVNLQVLEHITNRVLRLPLHTYPQIVESVVLALLTRFSKDGERPTRLRNVVAPILAVLWIRHERNAARTVLLSWLTSPARYSQELTGILSTLREAFVVGLTAEGKEDDDALRHRALQLAQAIVEEASRGLAAQHSGDDPNAEDDTDARECARLLDVACRELYFSSGAGGGRQSSSVPSGSKLEIFFDEVAPILDRISDYATPHTVYYLLQLIEHLLSVNPRRAFDLTARALQHGGSRWGFHHESLGADIFVRLVGIFLADHKDLFENDDRRVALINCLEIFMAAGWPAAQRLLYRLPELLQ